jgi:hypothetical protein
MMTISMKESELACEQRRTLATMAFILCAPAGALSLQ